MTISAFSGCKKKDNGVNDSDSSKKTAQSTGGSKSTSQKSSASTGTVSQSAKNQGTGASASNGSAGNYASNQEKKDGNDSTMPENDGGGSDESSTGEKNYDLKGREIKVLYLYDDVFQVPSENYGTRLGDVKYKLFLEAEQKFNCKFVFEQIKTEKTAMQEMEQALLAGVYYADAIRLYRYQALPKYEKLGMILPLNDYIDFSAPAYQKYEQINGVLYPDKIYAFYNCATLTFMSLFYNKNITEREGLPDIMELDRQGNWNWDTFADMAIRATKDTDGDGVIDQWGAGANNATTLSTAILYSNLAPIVGRQENGEYKYNLMSSQALKALQFVSDLYHTYKVVPNKNALSDFRQGKLAMYIANNASHTTTFVGNGITNVGCVVLPYGPDNPGNMYMREQGSHMYFYLSNIEDPEAVVNAMAWWNVPWDESKSDYVTFEDMELGNAELYFGSLQDPQSNIDYFMSTLKSHKLVYDYVRYFDPTNDLVTKEVFNKIAAQVISPVSNIKSIETQVEDAIKTAIN